MAMKLVNRIGTYVSEGNQFRGLERKPFGEAGSFWDMENMSGEHWPVLKTRGKRRKVRTVEEFDGFFGHDGVGWIDKGKIYWNGTLVTTITAGKKTIVEMGAQAVIFPDKYLFNMSTGDHGSLENKVEITNGTVTYTASDLLGYSADYRTAVYVKVSAAGLADGFHEGDVAYLSGCQAIPEGFYQLYSVLEGNFVVLATMSQQTATESALTVTRDVPDMDYVTECDNRIWGCSSANHEIYCCALGDPYNWSKYQGLANDSYAATIGTPGDFTGAATHLGYVLFFKEDVIHKVFGNKPSNFQVTTVHARGVEAGSAGSLCLMNETLYYKSRTGMVSYEGSLPSDIGDALGYRKYRNAVSGANNGRMWVSMQEAKTNGTWDLFVYSGRTGYWYREDASQAEGFLSVGGSMYMAKGGAIWLLEGPGNQSIESGAEDEGTISWRAETGDLDITNLYKRHLQKIQLRMRVTEGAACEIQAQYDGGEWATLKTVSGKDDKKAVAVPIVPHRCDHMRIRLKGTGEVRLVELDYTVWAGSEL